MDNIVFFVYFYLHIRLICPIFVSVKRKKDMKTGDFKKAVDEIKVNGGIRQTMYVNEVWKRREMTIFTYRDGSAEVFESTRPFMSFGSEVEAVAVINKMQVDYDKAVAESRARTEANRGNLKVEYCSLSDYYGRYNVYYGD